MTKKDFSEILKLPWTHIEEGRAEVAHIVVHTQEFYAFAYRGNLLFTPEEIHAAQLRFSMYPKVERTWPVWILSEEDIKGLAKELELDIEGLDFDTIVHYFKKGFEPLTESWETVLEEAIEQARTDKLIH